ncbi:MAG: hypothetical protein EA397_11310 [Deltaproteobacteria bacterium]|nr:MAG: hypothetical protein EA397_11310 [Deltaproteobacteria bacterium]
MRFPLLLVGSFTLLACSETGLSLQGEQHDPRPNPGNALLELSPSTLSFDDLAPFCTVSDQITARSVGDTSVTITAIDLPSPFQLGSVQLPVTLSPDEELALPITWVPEVDASADLVVHSNADDGRTSAAIVGTVRALDQRFEVFTAPHIPLAEVYIAGSRDIYEWDPGTNTTTFIGRSTQNLFDLAIDYDGNLLGCTSGNQLLRIDPDTGDVSNFLTLSVSGGNALTVLPDNRIILASGTRVYEIDRATGHATTMLTSSIGSSSGDIVAIGDDLYWSVTSGDRIVRIDTRTTPWTEELVGNTGRSGLWGLASPADDLWAFSSGREAHRISTTTGAVLETLTTGVSAYGATHNPFFMVEDRPARFTLGGDPVASSIVVYVDGDLHHDWTYDDADNAILFEPGALEGGETVEVRYGQQGSCGE